MSKSVYTVDYKCDRCKASEVKLWRGVHGVSNDKGEELLCASCLMHIDPSGRGEFDSERTDQVKCWLPAVPTEDTFWGYCNVPEDDVNWWRNLPTYAFLTHVDEVEHWKFLAQDYQTKCDGLVKEVYRLGGKVLSMRFYIRDANEVLAKVKSLLAATINNRDAVPTIVVMVMIAKSLTAIDSFLDLPNPEERCK